MNAGCALIAGPEPVLDAQVELDVRPSEPHAAPRRELRRLGDLLEAEHVAVELHRGLLLALRHRELDVVEPDDASVTLIHRRRSLHLNGKRAGSPRPVPTMPLQR